LAAVHRFASLIIASAVAITPALAQTASELRISGTVEKLGGNLAALSLSQGISLVVRLDSEPRVNSVAKGSGSDLKAGSQVSIQAKSGQSGDLIATQIVLFGPGSNRPDTEPGPDNAQLVATIKNTNTSPEGPVLTVADKDEDRKITIGPDTAMDCTGSSYHRHQGRLGGHDDRSETEGWVITGASSHHWSGRGRQSTAIAEPRAATPARSPTRLASKLVPINTRRPRRRFAVNGGDKLCQMAG
jgi:hypothetical protein